MMKTPLFNLHDVILLLTIAVALLLAVFQWLLSQKRPLASYFLGGFFVCIGLGALGRLLLWNDYIPLQDSFMGMLLPYLLGLEQLGKGPLLYFYVLALTGRLVFSAKQYLPHTLPFAAYCFLVVLDGVGATQMRFMQLGDDAAIRHLVWLWDLLKYFPAFYALATVAVVFRYQTQLKNYYSDYRFQGPLWLKVLTLGFAFNWFWSLLVHVSSVLFTQDVADSFGIVDN